MTNQGALPEWWEKMSDAAKAVGTQLRSVADHTGKHGLRVLDVGSGPVAKGRSLSQYAFGEYAEVYHTLDFDPSCGPTFAYDLTKQTPLEADSYDVVIASEVLEHVYDIHAAIREIVRLAGGIAVISIPFVYEYHRAPNDYWRASPDAIDKALRAAGAADVRAHFINNTRHTFAVATKHMLEWGSSLEAPRNG